MKTNCIVGLIVLTGLVFVASAGAQQPPAPAAAAAQAPPTQGDVDRLEAQAFALEVRLAAAEQELGQEKAKRAAYDMEALKLRANTLRPSVRALVGLPVTDKPPGTPPPPAPAPKDPAPPKE